ncbi:MAG: type II secretion system minor pseudopilin GspK [Candidatus Binatia bacterium]
MEAHLSKTRRDAPPGRAQRGVALFITLLSVTLLSIVVMEFTFYSQVEYRRMAASVKAQQARLLAESGVMLAASILAADARTSDYDSLGEVWARTIPPIDTGFGKLALRIEDETGRFNLNRLQANRPVDHAVFARLLEIVGVDPGVAGTVADWIDADDAENRTAEGAESSYYLSLEEGYRPRNGPMRSFAELALVKGIKAEVLRKLRPLVSANDHVLRTVNVNTAPTPVLGALHERMDNDLVARILERRTIEPFTNWQDLRTVEGMETLPIQSLVSFTSNTFRVRSSGGVDGVYQSVEASLYRTGSVIDITYWLARRGPNIEGVDSTTIASLEELSAIASSAAGLL